MWFPWATITWSDDHGLLCKHRSTSCSGKSRNKKFNGQTDTEKNWSYWVKSQMPSWCQDNVVLLSRIRESSGCKGCVRDWKVYRWVWRNWEVWIFHWALCQSSDSEKPCYRHQLGICDFTQYDQFFSVSVCPLNFLSLDFPEQLVLLCLHKRPWSSDHVIVAHGNHTAAQVVLCHLPVSSHSLTFYCYSMLQPPSHITYIITSHYLFVSKYAASVTLKFINYCTGIRGRMVHKQGTYIVCAMHIQFSSQDDIGYEHPRSGWIDNSQACWIKC